MEHAADCESWRSYPGHRQRNSSGKGLRHGQRSGSLVLRWSNRKCHSLCIAVSRYGDRPQRFRAAAGFAIPISSAGDVTGSSNLRWKIDQGTPYVPSPSLSGNRLYFTQANTDVLSVVDATSGKPLADRKRLSGVGTLYSSPLIAGGYVYFAGREGTTVVIKDDSSLETVAVNSLGNRSMPHRSPWAINCFCALVESLLHRRVKMSWWTDLRQGNVGGLQIPSPSSKSSRPLGEVVITLPDGTLRSSHTLQR